MSPLENSTNIAARVGRWSARHRKTAIFGWPAFVVVAVVVGASLGTKTLDPYTIGVGESKRAQEIIDAGGFVDSADESVLVASETHTAGDPAFRAVLADVARTVAGEAGVSNVASPLDENGGIKLELYGSALCNPDLCGWQKGWTERPSTPRSRTPAGR